MAGSQPALPADTAAVQVRIHMAEDGFMCPFLTPVFLDVLDKKGAAWVVPRPASSEVEFAAPLEVAPDQEALRDWLRQVGYDPELVSFPVFDTLDVLPPIPPAP